MEFDIFNSKCRPVKCVENELCSMSVNHENAGMLTVGQIYNVTDVEVHSWHTLISLKEFPGYQFNSVQFEEVEE